MKWRSGRDSVAAADHRSDIFSLGVLLYEMATGRRPFGGKSSADVSASILTSIGKAPEQLAAIPFEVTPPGR